MDPLTGTLVALAVAWASILAAIFLPLDRWIPAQRFRLVGALTLALLALVPLGVPLPPGVPLAVLVVGLGAAAAWPRRPSSGGDDGAPFGGAEEDPSPRVEPPRPRGEHGQQAEAHHHEEQAREKEEALGPADLLADDERAEARPHDGVEGEAAARAHGPDAEGAMRPRAHRRADGRDERLRLRDEAASAAGAEAGSP